MIGDGIVGQDRDRCLPWKWRDIVRLHVFKRPAANPQSPGPFVLVDAIAPAAPQQSPPQFYERLDTYLDRLQQQGENEHSTTPADFLRWDPKQPAIATYSLAGALGEIGRWPRLSRMAKVIHHISVDKAELADTDEIVVIPEVRLDDTVTLVPKPPGSFAFSTDLAAPVIDWQYQDPNPDGARCYLVPRKTAPPSGLQHINLATHWIEVQPPGDEEHAWHGYDQTAEMPVAVAEGLTLSRAVDRMLAAAAGPAESLRGRLDRTDMAGAIVARPGLRWLRRAIRRSLAEATLVLAKPGPDGRRPVEVALDAILLPPGGWKAEERAALAKTIVTAFESFERDAIGAIEGDND
jgi:hypothetical protein